jgi:snurportin-1
MRPIPYHTDTSLSHLSTHIIPLAKTHQSLRVEGPGSLRSDPPVLMDMDVESVVEVTINSDGLLLYVAEASYECGTSPLSSWIPLTSHSPHFEHTQSEDLQSPIDRFQRFVFHLL